MSWDNSVNEKAVIYVVATTIGVRNMPLNGRNQRVLLLSESLNRFGSR